MYYFELSHGFRVLCPQGPGQLLPRAFRDNVITDLQADTEACGFSPDLSAEQQIAVWEWLAQGNDRTDRHVLNGKAYYIDSQGRWFVNQ